MSTPRLVALVIGIWIGASLTLFACVGYSFRRIDTAPSVNPQLRRSIDFDPSDVIAKKKSVLWLYASELNRGYFYGWNRAQLLLACATLVLALIRCPRASVVFAVLAASLIVVVLTFYLAPEVTLRGRALEVPYRDRGVEDRETFDFLHQLYLYLEIAKVVLLAFAAILTVRGAGRQSQAITKAGTGGGQQAPA